MVASAPALVIFTTLAATATHVGANPNNVLHELAARQSFNPGPIPQQCQEVCSSLMTALTNPSCDTDITCVCGPDISSKTLQCAQCDVSVIGEDKARTLYDTYADICKSGGITVPSFSVSGSSSGGGSGTDSSSNGSSGSSGSGNGSSGSAGSGNGASNLQMSAAGLLGIAALTFFLA